MTPKAPTYIESDTVALPDAWLERGDHRIPLKLRVDPSEVGALDGDPLGGANAEHAREIAARLDAVRQTVDAVDATVGQLDRPLETFAAADSPVARSVASLPQPALRALLANASAGERRGLQSKISRLRREPKDSLVAKVVCLEGTATRQKDVENRLREEILRLSAPR